MQGKMDKYNGNRAVMEITGQIGKLSDLKSSKNGRDFVEFSLGRAPRETSPECLSTLC